MAGVHQSTYLTSKAIALDWWKSLPLDAVQVAAKDENGKRLAASVNHFHQKDGSTTWVVWRDKEPDSEVMVDARPLKDKEPKWEMSIHWHYGQTLANKTTAEIVKKALIGVGAVCTFDSAPDKK